MPEYKNNYVPALPPDILAPPPTPLPDAPLVRNEMRAENAWFVLTLANVLVAVVIIVGMLVDGSTARRAILFGAVYFFPTMAIFVLALTGTITDVIRSGQREKTERFRIDAYADLGEKHLDWRLAVERNRLLELERDALPADYKRRLAALENELLDRDLDRADADPLRTPTWVQPYPTRREASPALDARTEALRWAAGLYQEDGTPNPEFVQMTGKETAIGRIQNIRMLGSARGEGSDAARLWLLDHAIILPSRYGYSLNIAKYPRADTLRYVE